MSRRMRAWRVFSKKIIFGTRCEAEDEVLDRRDENENENENENDKEVRWYVSLFDSLTRGVTSFGSEWVSGSIPARFRIAFKIDFVEAGKNFTRRASLIIWNKLPVCKV